MAELSLLLDYVAAIPVGHRVQIDVYDDIEPGFFGKDKVKEMPHDALVKDLDTGIEYGAHWLYQETMGIRFVAGNEYPLEVRPELPKVSSTTGKVVGCRVLSERVGPSWQVQTTLRVEVE